MAIPGSVTCREDGRGGAARVGRQDDHDQEATDVVVVGDDHADLPDGGVQEEERHAHQDGRGVNGGRGGSSDGTRGSERQA